MGTRPQATAATRLATLRAMSLKSSLQGYEAIPLFSSPDAA